MANIINVARTKQRSFIITLLDLKNAFGDHEIGTVISGGEKENQILLNRFTVWCRWSDMIIRVDKCSTFGIKKHLTKSIQ